MIMSYFHYLQIARAAAVFSVNEVIVFDEYGTTTPGYVLWWCMSTLACYTDVLMIGTLFHQ